MQKKAFKFYVLTLYSSEYRTFFFLYAESTFVYCILGDSMVYPSFQLHLKIKFNHVCAGHIPTKLLSATWHKVSYQDLSTFLLILEGSCPHHIQKCKDKDPVDGGSILFCRLPSLIFYCLHKTPWPMQPIYKKAFYCGLWFLREVESMIIMEGRMATGNHSAAAVPKILHIIWKLEAKRERRGGVGNWKCYETFETAKPNPSCIAPTSWICVGKSASKPTQTQLNDTWSLAFICNRFQIECIKAILSNPFQIVSPREDRAFKHNLGSYSYSNCHTAKEPLRFNPPWEKWKRVVFIYQVLLPSLRGASSLGEMRPSSSDCCCWPRKL